MGTLMEEVDYCDSDENDHDDVHDIHPHILHLQTQNHNLQMQLKYHF